MNARHPVNRTLWYAMTITAFSVCAVSLAAINHVAEPRILYLVAMFALCASPLLDLDALNGRWSMLAVFTLVYFVFFALGDFTALWDGMSEPKHSFGAISVTECLILFGGLALILGYRAAVRRRIGGETRGIPRDWPEWAVVLGGGSMFIAGTAAAWYLKVYVMPDKGLDAGRRLAELDPKLVDLLLIGDYVLPLGIMVLAYAYARYRRLYMTAVILAVVVMQAVTGIVTDEKAIVMKGGLIVILTKVLIDGKLPKMWLAGAALFVALGYPVLTAFRSEVIGAQGMNHQQVAEHLGQAIMLSITAASRPTQTKGPEQTQNFVQRASMKSSVELAVEGVGNGVGYQYGSTLAPLLTAFIPRFILPDKGNGDAGRLFGKEFRASTYTDTYISPSHLGELYWNFGWPGALVGMYLIGLLLGYTGKSCDFTQYQSVTRVLVYASTVYLLVWGFEASIAIDYSVWIRGLVVVGALHLALGHVPARAGRAEYADSHLAPAPAAQGTPPFSNLLR